MWQQACTQTAEYAEEKTTSPNAVFRRKKVQLVEKQSDSEEDDSPVYVGTVKDNISDTEDVNGTDVRLKLDTRRRPIYCL